MAYTFTYAYQLDPAKIAGLQRRHADMCEALGSRGCRILELEQSTDVVGERQSRGRLKLAVASDQARKFGTQLSGTLGSVDGHEIASSISGEDLSKAMVDTEAGLRARTMLRDRLMEVLATRKGTVAELVEAERSVATVNEEIDRARSWLTEMQGRVEFSVISIDYQPNGASALVSDKPNAFLDPIRGALGAVAGLLGGATALLIALIACGLPVFAVLLGLRRIWPWLGTMWGRFAPRAAQADA